MPRVASRDAHRSIVAGKLGGHAVFAAKGHTGIPAP